jgi:hypothetical protein
MDLKSREFEIPDNEPYKNDLLNRQEFGENLTKIVSQVTSPLIISVNGSWGTGKTVFLKMWDRSLKKAGYSTIYFSAWEDDYCDNALLALIGQIWGSIKEGDLKEMGNTLKEIAVPLIKNIGTQMLTNATRVATAGLAELNAKDLESNIEKMLDEYVTATSDIKNIKEKLVKFSEKSRQKTEKPLVIIIDELDRCRPLFAIELLEKIKHLFELPGVIFVLGIDREQLGHSIQSVYGNIDVDGYLRRFIDLEFLLKAGDATHFYKNILEKYRYGDTPRLINSDWVMLVSKCFRLSLRDLEYLARTVVVGSIINSELAERLILPLLIALKLRDEDFYKKILTGKCNATEIIEHLVSKHNALELFGIDPDTNEYVGGFGIGLCSTLYALSPRSWRVEVGQILHEGTDKHSQLLDEFFHPVVQKVFYMEKGSTKYFDSKFEQTLHYGIPINDISKCIELIEFKDETK